MNAVLASTNDALGPVRRLTCCCCGETTTGRQWWNRDTGFGLCPACIPLCSRKTSPEDMTRCYGVRGVHHDLDWKPADEEVVEVAYACLLPAEPDKERANAALIALAPALHALVFDLAFSGIALPDLVTRARELMASLGETA